jgi:hypothetical protein
LGGQIMRNFIELTDNKCALIYGGRDETTAKVVREIARIIGTLAKAIYNIRQFLKACPI